MQGAVAQALALTVAGNAFLMGWDIGPFWPDSEAFAFCEQVRFLSADGSVATDPDEWLRQLRLGGARLKLRLLPRNDAGLSSACSTRASPPLRTRAPPEPRSH